MVYTRRHHYRTRAVCDRFFFHFTCNTIINRTSKLIRQRVHCTRLSVQHLYIVRFRLSMLKTLLFFSSPTNVCDEIIMQTFGGITVYFFEQPCNKIAARGQEKTPRRVGRTLHVGSGDVRILSTCYRPTTEIRPDICGRRSCVNSVGTNRSSERNLIDQTASEGARRDGPSLHVQRLKRGGCFLTNLRLIAVLCTANHVRALGFAGIHFKRISRHIPYSD